MTSPSPASILALPAELTEHVLILTAHAGFPTAIAALARSCRPFAALVYHSPDAHLWREVFLSTFDDPRLSPSSPFDWGTAFRARIWAANFLNRGHTHPASSRDDDDGGPIDKYARALDTLVDVARSALPYPPTICALPCPNPAIIAANTVPGSAPQPGFPSYPIFPPSPDSSHPSCSLTRSASRNVRWLDAVVARGLPPDLARRLSAKKWDGGIMGEALDDREKNLMQALGRVVAFTGFRPARGLATPTSGSSSDASVRSASDNDNDDDDEGSAAYDESSSSASEEEEENDKSLGSPGMTPARLAAETFVAGASVVAGLAFDASVSAQARRARRLARMRVYNLRFLSPARAWGPFHLVDAAAMDAAPDPKGKSRAPAPDTEDELPCADTCDVGSDDEESDWAPLPEHHSSRAQPQPPLRLPPPAALAPDWAFLAAVRVVVEANLREAVGASELAGLTALDGLRAASAPIDLSGGGDTGAVRSIPAPPAPFQGDRTRATGKGRDDFGGPADSSGVPPSGDGWDWAGVTGIWRRCICWLDYRDLISHNLSSDFNDPELTEAVRIVPMRLRVAGYAPPAVPAFPDKPTLLVEGETAADAHSGVRRRLRGSVRAVKDGSIHWQIVLVGQNPGDADEWITEGVQIGGTTSAMGVLGLWTGSQHERMDPLGPFWAWKVG
ncbi:hypothetical protein DAEQUDRAFT_769469 [Daedalea quercina L-15889]|uniref:F-box domain-containing protein n=1 Tax=Daedalea quercina L-15889 TaxID=1314783 RepID=A0A165LP56_9APHY|nr:hypothetical protein DAEQUDRAFT_769469 [Daedalea quercina L-15889]